MQVNTHKPEAVLLKKSKAQISVLYRLPSVFNIKIYSFFYFYALPRNKRKKKI